MAQRSPWSRSIFRSHMMRQPLGCLIYSDVRKPANVCTYKPTHFFGPMGNPIQFSMEFPAWSIHPVRLAEMPVGNASTIGMPQSMTSTRGSLGAYLRACCNRSALQSDSGSPTVKRLRQAKAPLIEAHGMKPSWNNSWHHRRGKRREPYASTSAAAFS